MYNVTKTDKIKAINQPIKREIYNKWILIKTSYVGNLCILTDHEYEVHLY